MTDEDDVLLKKALGLVNTFKRFAPTNIKEQKKLFFKNENFEPQFTYNKLPLKKIEKAKIFLKSIKIENDGSLRTYILKRRIKEAKLKIKLVSSIGNPQAITLYSEKLYGLKFNKSYLKQAMKDASIPVKFKQTEKLNAKETKAAISNYLKKYSKDAWNIVTTTKNDFYIQVRYKQNLITISEDINWDFTDITSALAHEIDGHVVRAINALNHTDPLMRDPFPFYIKTEEGLACFLGDYCSPNGAISLKHHAIKYLAGYFALSNSFRETYRLLLDFGFTRQLAFQRTLRLKKGLTDTSLPGCNAREAMYYEGMLEVKRYIDKGGNLKKLFAAKAGLEDLKYVTLPDKLIIPASVSSFSKSSAQFHTL